MSNCPKCNILLPKIVLNYNEGECENCSKELYWKSQYIFSQNNNIIVKECGTCGKELRLSKNKEHRMYCNYCLLIKLIKID